jgi:hypothetical protein
MTTLTTEEIVEEAYWLKRSGSDTIRWAIEQEREAILDLVDAYAKNNTDLADAIRARGGEAT